MSKFLLNLLLQISKAFVNSKIQFLMQKFFFLILARPTLRPTRPLSPASPSSPRVGHVFAEICFPFQIMPSRADRLLPLLSPCGPRLSSSSSPPRRPTPVGIFRAPLPRASDAPKLLQPSLITLPLNPLQTER
jgi:hypothetical protein